MWTSCRSQASHEEALLPKQALRTPPPPPRSHLTPKQKEVNIRLDWLRKPLTKLVDKYLFLRVGV